MNYFLMPLPDADFPASRPAQTATELEADLHFAITTSRKGSC